MGRGRVYVIQFRNSAAKELRAIDSTVRTRIGAAINGLAHNPRPHGVQTLSGPERYLRIRVGDYRVIYQVHDDRVVVLIIRVRHRREAYE